MQPTGSSRLVIGPDLDGERIDRAIAAATALSRRGVRELIAAGAVWRNGHSLRVQSRTVEVGDVVDVLLPPEEVDVDPARRPVSPRVLLDDGWLLAADKPTGELSQPDERDPRALSFDRQVLVWLAWSEGRRPYLRLMHRLDRVTSGVLLFARCPAASAPLSRAWRSGAVERWYLAVVDGAADVERLVVDRPIRRDSTHRWRFEVADDGRPARTEVRLAPSDVPGRSVAICRLDTGRTHQVRVHLASIGHPVTGDALYGGSTPADVHRALLHAAALELPHPRDGRRVVVTSPAPDDVARHFDAEHPPHLPTTPAGV
jgi:23S rRNA pseudouridine1911/1915/1917 synthase